MHIAPELAFTATTDAMRDFLSMPADELADWLSGSRWAGLDEESRALLREMAREEG